MRPAAAAVSIHSLPAPFNPPMEAILHWFPFYSSDFIGATVGLSCLERSLYALMIPLYYEVGPFPAERVRVYRVVGCESDEQKRAVDYLLGQFFVLRDDGWYQPKAERVKADSATFHAQAVERGKRSANARREKYGSAQPNDRKAFESVSKASGNASEPTTTTTTTIATTKKEKTSPPLAGVACESGKPDSPAYRVPDCPYGELLALYAAKLPTLPQCELLTDTRKAHLQARWRQVCADDRLGKAEGVDWFASFFEHVAASRFLTGRTAVHGDRKPFRATLDWLMKPENFAKVYEGRYSDEKARA